MGPIVIERAPARMREDGYGGFSLYNKREGILFNIIYFFFWIKKGCELTGRERIYESENRDKGDLGTIFLFIYF